MISRVWHTTFVWARRALPIPIYQNVGMKSMGEDTILPIEHIVRTPDVMGGKPRIAGQRVSVANIAVLYVIHKWSVPKISRELDLTPSQIHAALSYYYDHRDEIDKSIEGADRLAMAVGVSHTEKRKEIEERWHIMRAGHSGNAKDK